MSIPEDLVIQILIKLPVKLLLKFKSVSKTWLSIISSSNFIKYHVQSASRVFSLCEANETVSRIPVLPPIIRGEKTLEILQPCRDIDSSSYPVKIVGSCNGLVCVAVRGMDFDTEPDVLILWNPATKEFHKMPCSGSYNCHTIRILHGFGYDASGDDYKIVESCCSTKGRKYSSSLKIYSLRSNLWKLLDSNAFTIDKSGTMGIFVNGAIHWRVNSHRNVIAINLTSEAAIVLETPVDRFGFQRLGVSEECLCLCHFTHGYTDYWMMQEYGNKGSWTKILRHQPTEDKFFRVRLSFKVPEYDQGSGKSEEEWTVEKVCQQFNELPLTQDYIKFETQTYSESLVSVSPG